MQNIDNVVINPDEQRNVINLYKSFKNTFNDNTERGRGAGRRPRGNHREGQIVNNNNVDNKKAIRNQITQISNPTIQ